MSDYVCDLRLVSVKDLNYTQLRYLNKYKRVINTPINGKDTTLIRPDITTYIPPRGSDSTSICFPSCIVTSFARV